MEGESNTKIFSKSKTFLAFCFSFLFAIISCSFLTEAIPWIFLIVAVCVNSIFFILFFSQKKFRFFLLCVFFFLLGVFRINSIFPSSKDTLSFFNNSNQVLFGFVSREPDIRQDAIHYVISVQKIYTSGASQEISGRLALKTSLYPRYEYGQNLEIHCDLEAPQAFEGFRYDKYLAVQNIWSVCKNPNIFPQEGKNGNIFFSFLYEVKSRVAEKINVLWHEPYASFVAGLLYGYRGGLGTLSEEFRRTGVSHIVAVSGFNITLIALFIQNALGAFCIPRKKAFWIIVVSIFIFVLFTGASASVVRAGIMGILALLSVQLGRRSRIDNILVATLVIMSCIHPLSLIWDFGFQLSVLSTCGLVYLSPVLEKYFKKIPNIFSLKESLQSTLSAIIFTLPLLLFQFGTLSLLAPIVNILILPLIPYSMAAGFITLFFSFFSFPIAKFFAFCTYLILALVVRVVHFFSNVSFAVVTFEFSFFFMLLSYVILLRWIVKQKML